MTNNRTSRYAVSVLMTCLVGVWGSVAWGVPTGFTYSFTTDSLPSPQRAGGLALGDFNGDGQMDAAVPGVYMAGVAVLLNNGSGGAVNTWVGTGAWPVAVAAGDLDGDGDTDLAIVERDNGGVAIYSNNGVGVFTRTAFYATGDTSKGICPTAVAVADIDKDGKLDLVVANRTAETVVVLHNTGSGFVLQQTVAVTWEPNALVAVDVDKDGWMDVAVACASDDTVKVLKNTNGVLSLAGTYEGGEYPVAVTAGDINGDGYPDLVVADREGTKPTVLINNTAGQFSVLPLVPPSSVVDALVTDTNFDGRFDILTSSGTLVNNGDGSFTAQTATTWTSAFAQAWLTGNVNPFVGYNQESKVVVTYQAPPGQPSGVAGDTNGDGHVDVVDLLSLVSSFGLVAGDSGYDANCDFNGDGSVDVGDLLVLVESFGK